MLRHTFFIFLFSFFASQSWAQGQAEKLTINEAIRIALESNFNIQLAKNIETIATNNNSLGNAGFLPTVDVSGQYSNNNNIRFEASNQEDSVFVLRNLKSNNYGLDATLNWVLFDGTKMFVTLDKLAAIQEQAKWDSKVVIENTLSNTISAYYNIINEKSRLFILQDALGLSNQRLQIAKSKYELGKFSKAEYLSAQVDYNADKSAVIAQKGLLNGSKVRLNVLLARKAETTFTVADSVITVENYFEISALRYKVEADNYQLAASKVGLLIASREKREIETELLPTIALQANTGIGGSTNPVGFLRTTNTTSLNYGLTASWRIFDGFNKNRRIQNAVINEYNQEVSLNSLRNELLGALETQFVLYQNRLELIRLEVNNVEVARENSDLALERFKVGRSNSLDLREAQLNTVQAAGRLLNALYEAKMAEIELLRISGTTILEN
ncbi:MAG: outer membrane protein [Marivirga sp.]|jgi:outer membrane protein